VIDFPNVNKLQLNHYLRIVQTYVVNCESLWMSDVVSLHEDSMPSLCCERASTLPSSQSDTRLDIGNLHFYLNFLLSFILTTSLYCLNLHVPCSTDVRKYFFCHRIVKVWNALPIDTDFSSIDLFKCALDGLNVTAYCDI